jgi:oligopeptide transport system permease protein
MIRYLLKKIVSLFITVFCVVTLTFFLMKAIPGDPFSDEKALPEEIHQSLLEHYGLNDPLPEQYVRYLVSVASWDLGPSLKYKGRTVNQLIQESFPISCVLGLEALALAIGIGLMLGTLSATYRRGWVEYATNVFVMIGVSLPSFACATFLQYLLAIKFQVFPVARWGTWVHTILPALSLAILPAAFITRLVRGQVEEVLKQDYIKVCKAKGLTDFQIMSKHVVKNTLLPIFAYFGQLSANILVGSFVVEKIFSIPGLGQWFVKSVMNRDYSVIMGLTVFYSILLVTMVCAFDLLGLWLDPRVRGSVLSDKLIPRKA